MSTGSPQGKKLGIISLIISILAIIVSAVAAYVSYSSNRDTAKSQVIQQSYETLYQLTHLQLENWQLSHIFALPDQYEGVTKLVSASFSRLEPVKQTELILKERALADIIFTIYEQNLYQWNQAKEAGDDKRASFLQEVLNYLTGRLLRNPRLLYYWSETGGGLSSSYENQTRNHYASNVLHNPQLPLNHKPDATGPFIITPVKRERSK